MQFSGKFCGINFFMCRNKCCTINKKENCLNPIFDFFHFSVILRLLCWTRSYIYIFVAMILLSSLFLETVWYAQLDYSKVLPTNDAVRHFGFFLCFRSQLHFSSQPSLKLHLPGIMKNTRFRRERVFSRSVLDSKDKPLLISLMLHKPPEFIDLSMH